jgi:hypothetical protein
MASIKKTSEVIIPMIAQFKKSKDQKQLYFQISAALKIQYQERTSGVAGIYAIYNGDTCVYVGQSQNIASRLATHLCGKFKDCTSIKVYFVDTDGFDDFYSRPAEAKKTILEYNEKCFIRLLNPIENINADHTFIPEQKFACLSLYEALETDGDMPEPDILFSNVDYGDLAISTTCDYHDISGIALLSPECSEYTAYQVVERNLASKGLNARDFYNKPIPMFVSDSYAILCVIRNTDNE